MSNAGNSPAFGAQAGALLTSMLLSDAAMVNTNVQALLTEATNKGIAAQGDPNVVIPAFMAVALQAPLMAPALIPAALLQGLKTFQALQALFNAYLASKLTTGS